MRVFVNGESKELSGTPYLAELITQLDLPAARIAVELNRVVVRRNEWSNTILHDGDRIEIVHFVGGGISSAFICGCFVLWFVIKLEFMHVNSSYSPIIAR